MYPFIKKNNQIRKIRVASGKPFHFRRAIIISLIVLALAAFGLYRASIFFDSNMLVFKAPAEIKFNAPISIEERETEITVQIIQITDGLPLTEDERYLCQKFGDQCKTALEVQRRENPTGNCEIFHVNNNGSVDFGFMQVNSIHLGEEVKISQLVNCKENIDVAYKIWEKSGWTAWTAYNKMK
jgi:hypothetical protein